MPPAAAVMGTPMSGHQGALLAEARHQDTVFMMGDNPALPRMPERPALKDFFLLRFGRIPRTHLLQSARVARENGLDEKVITACLLHDIAIAGLLTANHGYWGAAGPALCRRGSGLGHREARGAALLPGRVGGIPLP